MGKPPKQDRTLELKCTPHKAASGGWRIEWEETGSNPNMPNMVDKDGNIDLKKMPNQAKFTNRIDITITLDTSAMMALNPPVTGSWSTQSDGKVGSFCWFGADENGHYDPAKPITVPDLLPRRVSDTVMVIDDQRELSGPAYGFALSVELGGGENGKITIDPMLSSKGVGGDGR
ncbi:hypothetical protein ACXYL9_10060 [Qipengyuania sp. CAU 1752]